jgi:hypothetical protein
VFATAPNHSGCHVVVVRMIQETQASDDSTMVGYLREARHDTQCFVCGCFKSVQSFGPNDRKTEKSQSDA